MCVNITNDMNYSTNCMFNKVIIPNHITSFVHVIKVFNKNEIAKDKLWHRASMPIQQSEQAGFFFSMERLASS